MNVRWTCVTSPAYTSSSLIYLCITLHSDDFDSIYDALHILIFCLVKSRHHLAQNIKFEQVSYFFILK